MSFHQSKRVWTGCGTPIDVLLINAPSQSVPIGDSISYEIEKYK